MKVNMSLNNILEVNHLSKQFLLPGKRVLNAVNNVSFSVKAGETLAIVGESGCGKSTLGRLLLRLHEPSSGEVFFKGQSLIELDKKEMRNARKDMQMIFQDPFASLNPRMTIRDTLSEPLKIHHKLKGDELEDEVLELLNLVGLNPSYANRYPQEFSGGQRQRIAIARALATKAELIIGDEPLSALDVSVQAQIINLLNELKAKFGLTLVLISHDLSVIEHMADRVLVMYLGEVVESGSKNEIYSQPKHPYTQALLSAIPHPVAGGNSISPLFGEIPSPLELPKGCFFASRCRYAKDDCLNHRVALKTTDKLHRSSCLYESEIMGINSHDSVNQYTQEYIERSELYKHFSASKKIKLETV
ncbi:ATP-binding cassette domain-containing protein [Vibrio sp. SS-MA-C1-2]|uniref:ABC transporter ATP-binding protein n=1 Tax=Vibrio sp. SS-MA-C1-2 TaxID=2908646 RepID=UPI001F397844|nr:oligopeptide/dipeptide ABC transporter ATP-binding protein [Vibrio sp. SS-MA-C1-2]UJF17894.1 ATP-binding cassette domain-containing protein [Vibrio sp. SS-MA-C1-2]